MSDFMAMKSLDTLSLVLIACMISWAMRMLSVMSLSSTNSDYVGETISSISGFNLDNKIFEMILYRTEHRLIGLRSDMRIGSSIFGRRQR